MAPIRIALAQTNPIVGDLQGNLQQCMDAVSNAAEQGAAGPQHLIAQAEGRSQRSRNSPRI